MTFDADLHQYKVDGIIYPSVSDIIAPLGADMDDEDMGVTLEVARERGTACHEILALMLNGETEFEYPSSYEPYVDAIRLFISEHEIVPIAIETPIYSEQMGIAGTPDLLCEYDGVLSILDYKFVAQVAKTKVKAQLNAYRNMYNENFVFPEQLLTIQFLNNGTYRPYSTAIDDTEILTCLKLHELKNKKHSRGKID